MSLYALLTGDWAGVPHGPADAPPATAEDLADYARQGGVCMCSDCQCYSHHASTRAAAGRKR